MQELRKTTVSITVECQHALDNAHVVGALVVDALHELIAKAPSDMRGKFETKAGLDVAWLTQSGPVDEHGNPVLTRTPIARAVNDAVAA